MEEKKGRKKEEKRSGERSGRGIKRIDEERVTVKIQQLYLFLLSRLFSRVKEKNGITFFPFSIINR